jgi:anti-sigma B factor antagonist
MEIRKQACDGTLILHVEARRIDASVAMEFKDAIVSVIDEGNHELVIDLSQVEFLDSSGLGAIVGALKYLGHKGNLVLTGLSRSVLRVFELTRMDKVFRIAATIDDAVACAI